MHVHRTLNVHVQYLTINLVLCICISYLEAVASCPVTVGIEIFTYFPGRGS